MAGETRCTTDRDTIVAWADQRGAVPATVKGTGSGGEPGVLRLDFVGQGDEESLEKIGWDEFFEKFEEAGLAMLYQEDTADGATSRFVKFVSRDQEECRGH